MLKVRNSCLFLPVYQAPSVNLCQSARYRRALFMWSSWYSQRKFPELWLSSFVY